MLTISGIDIEAFRDKPTAQELAAIVARWHSGQQAEFLVALGEQLRFTCGGRVPVQWEHMANDLKELEVELCDGSGSELIRELADRLATPPKETDQ